MCVRIGAVLLGGLVLRGAGFHDLPKHVTEFRLSNGMMFVVMERPEAPVVAFHLTVKAGIADDPPGKGGIAQLFERMYFHGGEVLGSKNPAAERQQIQRAEQAFDTWKEMENRRPPADSVDVSRARVGYQMAAEQALALGQALSLRNALEAAGAADLSARVDADSSQFTALVPANQTGTWFRVTADWLAKPSPRGFSLERDSWREQRIKLEETSAQLRLEQALLRAGLAGNPYGRAVASTAETETLRVADFEKFAASHYVPGNVVAAIAGDVNVSEIRQLAEIHFVRIAGGAVPPALKDSARAPVEERAVSAALPPGSAVPTVLAWVRPPKTDRDDAVFDVIWALLASGSEALLPGSLKAGLIPSAPAVLPNFPGDRLSSLVVVSATPHVAAAQSSVEKAVDGAVEKLRAAPVADGLLRQAKMALRSRLTSEMESQVSMAGMLARFLAAEGNAAGLVKAWDRIEAVTPQDVQRVASQYLAPGKRIVVRASSTGGEQ